MNPCQRYESALEQAWLDQEEVVPLSGEWQGHLDQCPACAKVLADHQALLVGVAGARQGAAASQDPEEFLRRLWQAVDRIPAPSIQADRNLRRKAQASSWLPLAAAILVGIGIWFGLYSLLASSGNRPDSNPTNMVVKDRELDPTTVEKPAPSSVLSGGVLVLDLTGAPSGPLVVTLDTPGEGPDPKTLLTIWHTSHPLDTLEGPGSLEQEQLLMNLRALVPSLMVEPLARIAAGSGDLQQARAGLRLIGSRGSRRSVPILLASLQNADLRTAALAALRDFGPQHLPLTAEVFLDPDLGPLADQRLAAGPVHQQKDMLLQLSRGTDRDTPPPARMQAWMDLALSRKGEALDWLVASMRSNYSLREPMITAFCASPSVESMLEDAMPLRVSRPERELLMELVGRVQPPNSVDWLVERAGTVRDCTLACAVLLSMDTPQSDQALLDLIVELPRTGDAVLAAWQGLADGANAMDLAHLQGRHSTVAETLCRQRDRTGLRVFASLLEAAAGPATTPAALLLARQDILSLDRRTDLLRSTLPHLQVSDLDALAVLVDQASAGSTRFLSLVLLGAEFANGQEGLSFVLADADLAGRLHASLHSRSRSVRSSLYTLEQQLRIPSLLRNLRDNHTIR